MQGQKELAKSAKEREPATATASKNKKIESQNEVEKAAKESELELEQPPVKRKKVGSEMELYKEYTDERKKTELAWQRMHAGSYTRVITVTLVIQVNTFSPELYQKCYDVKQDKSDII